MSMNYLKLPTEEEQENARKEVNCTKDSIKKDIQHLMEWMEKQPHLPTVRDEDMLAHCLLQCKNSLEKTKSRLEMYFNTRALLPEIYANRNPFNIKMDYVSAFGMYLPLRKLTPDGYRVMIFYQPDDAKTSVVDYSSMDSFLQMCQITIEIWGKYDYSKGVILLFDGGSLTMALVTAFAMNIQKIALLYQKTMPIRYKKLYAYNVGRASELFMSTVIPMLSKKLASRVEVVKNTSNLCNIFPKEIIPRDYGGDELPLEELRKMWHEELKNQHEFLKQTENWIVDLTKIPKENANSELFGVKGSFRQISVD